MNTDLNTETLAAYDQQLINEVFARYVRAADHRDPARMTALFAADATLTIHYRGNGDDELLGQLTGAQSIGSAVVSGMTPHPPLGWSHHTILNPIVTVTDGGADFDAQFIVYDVAGTARPDGGWPAGASGAQGRITPIESGYYRATLRHSDTGWRITQMTIRHDLPYVFPEA